MRDVLRCGGWLALLVWVLFVPDQSTVVGAHEASRRPTMQVCISRHARLPDAQDSPLAERFVAPGRRAAPSR